MNKTHKLALSALFVSLMLILGYIESFIPTGAVPGIKLGLSNSVLLLTIYWLGVPASFVLMAAKVLLSGLLFAGFNSMMYSLAGGLMSMIGMSLMHRVKGMSPIGVGVVGGVMHNVGQVGLAMVIMQTNSLLFYLAILVVVGAVTGAATGTATLQLLKRLPPSMHPPRER